MTHTLILLCCSRAVVVPLVYYSNQLHITPTKRQPVAGCNHRQPPPSPPSPTLLTGTPPPPPTHLQRLWPRLACVHQCSGSLNNQLLLLVALHQAIYLSQQGPAYTATNTIGNTHDHQVAEAKLAASGHRFQSAGT
jgi:hypothetical protein